MDMNRQERALDHQVLREIVEGIAGETGEAFFNELARHLARAIGTKCAWVTEWVERERRLRALSFWVGDRFLRRLRVLGRRHAVRGRDHDEEPVSRARPRGRAVRRRSEPEPLGAVSHLGVPLLDTDGAVLGHLAVMHDQPLPEITGISDVFSIFASRAAAELRRLRRDRDLREREQELL